MYEYFNYKELEDFKYIGTKFTVVYIDYSVEFFGKMCTRTFSSKENMYEWIRNQVWEIDKFIYRIEKKEIFGQE